MSQKTLDEIVHAVRLRAPVSAEDLRYAVVAFDVLTAQLKLHEHPKLLAEYFIAAELPPKEYAGPQNDPERHENVEWYRAMLTVGAEH